MNNVDYKVTQDWERSLVRTLTYRSRWIVIHWATIHWATMIQRRLNLYSIRLPLFLVVISHAIPSKLLVKSPRLKSSSPKISCSLSEDLKLHPEVYKPNPWMLQSQPTWCRSYRNLVNKIMHQERQKHSNEISLVLSPLSFSKKVFINS